MARNIDKTDARRGEPRVGEETERRPGERVVLAETEARPGEPRDSVEGAHPAYDRPDVDVEPSEARQGEPRLMVRRTLLISLTLAVLAMVVIWFVFT